MPEKDLVFQPYKTIANSVLEDNFYSECINTENYKGFAGVNYSMTNLITNRHSNFLSSNSYFTFTASTDDYITISPLCNWGTGVAVKFNADGTLPAPLNSDVAYYLRKISDSTFGVYTTWDDAINDTSVVNITDTGTGTFYVTSILGKIIKIKRNYILDNNGSLWFYNASYDSLVPLSVSAQSGFSPGVGMDVYNDYVYMFRAGRIDRMNVNTLVVSTSWQTDAGGVSIVDKDNIMFIGVGNLIRSYDGTYNATALDLPENETVRCLSEIGQYLAIGTNQGKVFLWDKSFTTFETPITFSDEVSMLISVNNVLYAVLKNGDIYVTNGTSSQIAKRFPKHILGNKDFPSFVFSPDGFRVEDDSILIGYGTTSTTYPLGIYELKLDTNDFKLSYKISSGALGGNSTDRLQVTAIQASGTMLVGWLQAGTISGLDYRSITERYETGIVYSSFYKIGTKRMPKTLRHFDISLAEKLRTGQSIVLSYRTDLSGAFVEIGTFDDVSKISTTIDKAITVEDIQFKLQINTDENEYCPYVREVRCYD